VVKYSALGFAMRFCPECDARLIPDDEICPKCGYRLIAESPKRRPPRKQPRDRHARPAKTPRSRRRPRKEELLPPRRPTLRPAMDDDTPRLKKAPFNYGTWLGIIALILILIAVFLPWYTVDINIKTGEYSTAGYFELVKINGWEGFQLNKPPMDGQEQEPVFTLSEYTGGIPLTGLLFIIPIIIGFIRIFLAKKSKKRGYILIKTGIMCLISIIIILIIISQLPGIAKSYDLSEPYHDVLDSIASNPLKGEYIAQIEDRLDNHSTSAKHYEMALENHNKSLKNIEYPLLINKIKEKIDYSCAWQLIENAKTYHKKEEHLQAKKNYEKACKILETLQKNNYEAFYFVAWALQEEAEQYSKKEHHEDAIKKYEMTIKQFRSAKILLEETSKKSSFSQKSTDAPVRTAFVFGQITFLGII